MGKPLQVLIIADSENDARLIIRALKKGGYDPEHARVETLRAMREALRDKAWDIILCDYKLPRFSGPKAIALVKKLPTDIPLIMVAGAIGEENAALCLRAGARDFIRKDHLSRLVPAVKKELAQVKSMLKRRRGEKAAGGEAVLHHGIGKQKRVETETMRLNEDLQKRVLDQNAELSAQINERIHLEKALTESEAKFHSFMEEAPIGICLADLTGRVQFVNRKIEEKTGFLREELLSRDALALGFFDEETKRLLLARLAARLKGDVPRTTEVPVTRKDGSFFWVNLKTTILYQDGLPSGLLLAFIDVTDRKEMEQKILESEVKYRLLVENSSEVILVAQQGLLKFVNRASVDMFASSFEKLISAPFTDFIHPDDREMVMSNHLRRLRGEAVPSHYTFRVVTSTGIVRWAEIRSTVVSWEGKPATLNFLNDVTKRKQTEEKLKESEERFSAVFDHSRDCVYIIDLAGNFIEANLSALNLLGYDRADIPSLNIISLLHEADLARGAQEFAEIVRTGIQNDISEYTLKRQDGKLIHVEAQASLVYKEGKPYSVLGIARDITERKQAQETLQESEKKYRELVDFLPISLFEMDVQGKITAANPAVLELFGYTPSDLEAGLKSIQMIISGGLEKFGKNLQRLLNGEKKGPSEYGGVRKDGSTFPFVVFPSVIFREGKPTGIRGAIIDLTESKQAQEKLRKSEEKYRSILAGIEEGYFEVDLAGNFTFFNDSLYEMYGYSREELPGLHYSDYMDEANAKKLFTVFHTMYKTRSSPARYNYELIRKDGVKRYIEASATLIKDSECNVTGFRGIVRDVTERREMVEAIRASEERYRTIIEQMSEGYFEVDLTGHFTFVNDAQCLNLGYSREEMIGMHSRQYIVKEKRREVYRLFGKIRDTGAPVKAYDLQLIKKDGTEAYHAISVSLIRNAEGHPAGFRGISRDVTERRIAEMKLRDYAEEISDLYNNAPCGYHSIGADGTFLRINDTELTWLGYDRDELIGRKKWSDLLTPASREEFWRVFPVFKEQGWINDLEFDVIRKDGSVFAVLLNATAVTDKEGHFIRSRSTIFDVTQLKKVQLELREKNLELTRTYQDLRRKQAMILQQEKMASVGMLSAGVAHEIKNPLAIILQGINYLQTTVTGNELMIEVIGRLNKAVLHADAIVKGLLSYARQTPVALIKQDIRTLLDESLVLTEHEFRAKNIKLIKEYPPDLPGICLDGNQMKQVFVNLIINGIEAMPREGKFTISIRQVKHDNGKNALRLFFKDTGHGIPADKIKNVFDPFYTTKAKGNTGLGLSISKGIIDMHGGIIYAESPGEQGANFIIELPIPVPLKEV